MSLRPSEIAARINQDDPRRSLYRPLTEIAETVAKVEGLKFGLSNLDRTTGGLRSRRLNIIAGYSHHGKTSLMLRGVVETLREGKPCLFISGDDTDDTILHKMIAYMEHIDTEEVDRLGPQWRREWVEENIGGRFVLAATKDDYSIDEVIWTYELATEELGQPPAVVCFDYVTLLKLQADGQDPLFSIRDKFKSLKKIIRRTGESVWLVGHQCVKAAEDARALTLNHLEYGGHQEADGVVIGCRRNALHNLKDHELWEEQEFPKVFLSVMKNKVTGRKSMKPTGDEYIIDKTSGLIREVEMSDRPTKVMGGMSKPIRLTPLTVSRNEDDQ